MEALNRRLRFACLDGAEERTRQEWGRAMATEELERVLARYPGDVEPDRGP